MNLDEKLKRLKKEREMRSRVPAAAVESTWERIQNEAGLSTKEKLERLIHLTEGKPAPSTRKPVPFEPEPRKPLQVFENVFPPSARYGKLKIEDALGIGGEVLRYLGRDDAFLDLDLASTVFLDLETTGLSGGTGTIPFLVGLGYFREGSFVVAQYFLGDPSEEGRMLDELSALFAERGFKSLLTYNGKAFDLPLLETRFILQRKRLALSEIPHLDFLFAARSLWKHKHESCRLFHLAQQVIEAPRDEDIPGAEIPFRYFDYLRTGNFNQIEPILYHNQEDILSLLGLVISGAKLFSEEDLGDGSGPDPLDLVGVGKVFAGAGEAARSTRMFERALVGRLPSEVAVTVVRKLTVQLKKDADWEKAVALWQEGLGADRIFCYRELAMYYEHKSKNLAEAARITEEGLALAMETSAAERTDFEKRLARLNEKMRKGAGAGKSNVKRPKTGPGR
ncbi:MAG: ribonuclease H-like domain-containing protein [Candidatus Aminicenantes bacterium]|nr:ribonuclease H-like domain-containing protein [Candidatus Aminicenantes bacterium]